MLVPRSTTPVNTVFHLVLSQVNPKRGKPAAAHSLHGDHNGNILLGTVCNEIYEGTIRSAALVVPPPPCFPMPVF